MQLIARISGVWWSWKNLELFDTNLKQALLLHSLFSAIERFSHNVKERFVVGTVIVVVVAPVVRTLPNAPIIFF